MPNDTLYLTRFKDVSASAQVLATDDHSATAKSLIAAIAGFTIYIQRIVISVTTDNAATQTVRDTASTPVPILATKASPGVEADISRDFGEVGFALTAGKGLELVNSAAGLAYVIQIQAYARRTPGAAVSLSTASA